MWKGCKGIKMDCIGDIVDSELVEKRIIELCNAISTTSRYKELESMLIQKRKDIVAKVDDQIAQDLNEYDNICSQMHCITEDNLYFEAYKDARVGILILTPKMTPK